MSEGNKEQNEEEVFGECGPIHLKNVDWGILDHKARVMASLIKGVYVHERDRQKRRTGHKALGPIWWESFQFQHVQDLEDKHDHSIFGSILEYKPNGAPDNRTPKYVIAFRGTLLKWRTGSRDLYLDMKLLILNKKTGTRHDTALQAAQGLIDEVGIENVWLAGHSLGAAIALQVGKTLAKSSHYIETYLFNPPHCTTPVEKLPNPYLRTGIRMTRNLFTAGVSATLGSIISNQDCIDSFKMLSKWKPYVFANPKDTISCEYIGYFEHREKMESSGLGAVQKYIAKDSVLSLASSARGIKIEEALHQIPSAFLVKNNNVKETHGICQWWASHLKLQPKLYQF